MKPELSGLAAGSLIGIVVGVLIGIAVGEARKELEWQKYAVHRGKAEYRANQETGVVTWRWK